MIPKLISDQLDLGMILKRSAEFWDGGYTIAGAVGNGDCFVMRDPNGIRPCFYFDNDEFTGFEMTGSLKAVTPGIAIYASVHLDRKLRGAKDINPVDGQNPPIASEDRSGRKRGCGCEWYQGIAHCVHPW